jgi:hypothetical protein
MAKRIAQQNEETALATTAPNDAEWRVIEGVVVGGNLAPLTPEQRVRYLKRVCENLRLNWETNPFIYLPGEGGKLQLFPTKDCAAQLRRRDTVSIEVTGRTYLLDQGVYMVEVVATTPDGRKDSAIGCVGVKGMSHENLANQMMRAETKAKRRVTMSLCGLGLDGDDDAPIIAAKPLAGSRTTDSLMAGTEDGQAGVNAGAPSAINALLVTDDESRRGGTSAELPHGSRSSVPVEAQPAAATTKIPFKPEPKRDERGEQIVAKAVEVLGPLGFAVTDETASPAALDDEIEVLADELVALNDALGEKKTTVKAIRAWAQKTFPNDLAAQAAELKKRVEDKRAKVASLSTTA